MDLIHIAMDASFPIIAGFIASMLHVLTGPDHLAAVAPFAIESKRKAWQIGLFWGIGHLLGMIAIGLLFTLLKDFIPVELISEYSEKLVGFVLVGLGIWVYLKIFHNGKGHKHLHVHAEEAVAIHSHEHDHQQEPTHEHTHGRTLRQSNLASLYIGVLHGLAGVAHFLLFLPVLGFESRGESLGYISGFGLGIVVAMVAFALVIGRISALAKNGHQPMLFNGIRLSGGLFALAIGIYWIFST